jgi:hypothetical protein
MYQSRPKAICMADHAMMLEREQNLKDQLDQTGGVHDAKRLLQQRRQQPSSGMKPIWP